MGILAEDVVRTSSVRSTSMKIANIEQEIKKISDQISVLRDESVELLTGQGAIGNKYILIESKVEKKQDKKRKLEREREDLIQKELFESLLATSNDVHSPEAPFDDEETY